jgi:hypothetical protein
MKHAAALLVCALLALCPAWAEGAFFPDDKAASRWVT